MSTQGEHTAYRLYWINGSGSVDAVAEPIHASSDAEAIRQAESMAEGDRVELWQAARLVARIRPTTAAFQTLH